MRDLENAFPDGSGIFQQDSAPCHKSKKVTKFFESKNITVLVWPGNSPDLNPFENLWSIIKNRLRSEDCTTKHKLVEAIIRVWYRDPKIQESCQALMNSMPKRVNELIKVRGSHIMY